MKDKNTEYVGCPSCKSTVEINVRFAIKNGRVFCNTCCKAFDIIIKETEEEEEHPNEKTTRDDDGEYYW